MDSRFHWIHLATALGKLTAEIWYELLCNGGIPAMVCSGNSESGRTHKFIDKQPATAPFSLSSRSRAELKGVSCSLVGVQNGVLLCDQSVGGDFLG